MSVTNSPRHTDIRVMLFTLKQNDNIWTLLCRLLLLYLLGPEEMAHEHPDKSARYKTSKRFLRPR